MLGGAAEIGLKVCLTALYSVNTIKGHVLSLSTCIQGYTHIDGY